MAANPFSGLETEIAEAQDLDRRVEILVAGLADRIKSTSNDQNVQRLARELRQAAPSLIEQVVRHGA